MFTYKMKVLAAIIFSFTFFASFSLAQVCTPTPSGLVAWYPGNGNANDVSGNGNNGTLQNGATFAEGHVGQAFSFDGVDDHISIPHNANQNSSVITIDAWINQTSSGHGLSFVQKRTTGNVGGYVFETFHSPFGSVNALAFYIWINGTRHDLITGPNVITLGAWHHVAATYDGATMRIFVDGIERASLGVSGAIDAQTESIVVGRNVVNPSLAFHGLIDEITVYNRALTAAEIQAIFNAGTAGKCTGTLAASVQVSGRVMAANGRGIRNAVVSLTDSSGETRTAITSSFGYYMFDEVTAGETYILEVQSKRYRFTNPSRVISVADALADADFTALP